MPTIGAGYDHMPVMLTIDLQIRHLGAAKETELVAEGSLTYRVVTSG